MKEPKEVMPNAAGYGIRSDHQPIFESAGDASAQTRAPLTAELDEMVRDFCAVGPRAKSDVRRRIADYAAHATAALRAELAEKVFADARKAVQSIIDREREAENITAEIMDSWNAKVAEIAALRAERDQLIQDKELFKAALNTGLNRAEQAEQERDRLREALDNLMKAVTPELTGKPKNVLKSSWAEAWDKAEAALAQSAEPNLARK